MAKPKSKSTPMSQEESGILFWWVGLSVISIWAFGSVCWFLCSVGGAALCPWLVVHAAEASHERCGQKGWSSLSIIAGLCFALSALTAGSQARPFGALVVVAVCAAYYIKEKIMVGPLK